MKANGFTLIELMSVM
ncbi:prepilin-type N-terminal cleavage/methylation domain-containing protein [Acinetobacter towneri]